MLDPRLAWQMLIGMALLVLLAFFALALYGPIGLVPVAWVVLAFAAFVRAWTGKDDPPDPPKDSAREKVNERPDARLS